MKIDCHCGSKIFDSTDHLSYKGHLIPDQEWFSLHDALDDEVIDPIAAQKLSTEAAYMQARQVLSSRTRLSGAGTANTLPAIKQILTSYFCTYTIRIWFFINSILL